MKFIINLFSTFNFFRFGISRPIFSFKPIIIFSNFSFKKKDWDQNLYNYWSPLLLELERAIKATEPIYAQPRVMPLKIQKCAQVAGLFELSQKNEKMQNKGDFNVIKAKQFKHSIEMVNDIDDISIDDLSTVFSEYEPSEYSDWEESSTGSLSNSRLSLN